MKELKVRQFQDIVFFGWTLPTPGLAFLSWPAPVAAGSFGGFRETGWLPRAQRPPCQLPRLFAFNADRSCLCVADPAMAVVVVRLGDQPGAVAEVRALKHPRPVTDLAWVSGTSVAVADDGGVVGVPAVQNQCRQRSLQFEVFISL